MVMWSRPIYHRRVIVVYYNLIYYVFSTPASTAFFTIYDTTACPFFILLIDSLTVTLSIE